MQIDRNTEDVVEYITYQGHLKLQKEEKIP
jgi:hypothetical protein